MIQTQAGKSPAAVGTLRRLGKIIDDEPSPRLVLQAVRLAGHAEVAALLWRSEPTPARLLLDNAETGRPGLRQMLRAFQRQTEVDLPRVWNVFAPWTIAVDRVLSGETLADEVRPTLLRLARNVGY